MHLGLLYSNPSAGYLSELLLGVLERSSQSACQLVLEKCGARAERKALQKLLAGGVDGIILPPPLSDSRTALATLRSVRKPFVAVATGAARRDCLCLRIDNHEAAGAMTRYILSLGHTDLGFILGAANQAASAQRYAGFRAALTQAGLALRAEWVSRGDFSYRSGLTAAEQLLATSPRPSAILASNDDMAAATIAVAHRMGLAIPADLTVVGFDDTPLATTLWPPLTTVRQPIAAMGRKAVDLLTAAIQRQRAHQPSVAAQVTFDYALVPRESSGPPA